MLPTSGPLKKTSRSYKNKFAFDENIGKEIQFSGKVRMIS